MGFSALTQHLVRSEVLVQVSTGKEISHFISLITVKTFYKYLCKNLLQIILVVSWDVKSKFQTNPLKNMKMVKLNLTKTNMLNLKKANLKNY